MGVKHDLRQGRVTAINGWDVCPRRGQMAVAYECCPSIDDLPFDSMEWPFGLDKLLAQIIVREQSAPFTGYTVRVYESNAELGMLAPIYENSVGTATEAIDLAAELAEQYQQSRLNVIHREENEIPD